MLSSRSRSYTSSESESIELDNSDVNQPLLVDMNTEKAKLARRAKHAGRVGIANMATGFTIGGMLTMLYSVVEKFRAGPSPVPPPFNFIIFPILGILGLVAAGLSIAEAVLNPTRANIRNAIFNTGDGLATAGIIAASLIAPAVIIPIIPYVFMGIMGIQLAKKLYEAARSIYATTQEKDPVKKSGLKQVTAIHLTSATSFGLGIASVGVVMLFAHFALAPIGIAAGVFLSAFMGVLIGKTLYDKHKAKKAAPKIDATELSNLLDNELSPVNSLSSENSESYTPSSSQSDLASLSRSPSSEDLPGQDNSSTALIEKQSSNLTRLDLLLKRMDRLEEASAPSTQQKTTKDGSKHSVRFFSPEKAPTETVLSKISNITAPVKKK